ncbi:MAG: DUF5686 family protein [Flavobacteriaceae bacterium]|nr:DUF5686 family protein [Flavobacteriaceae bacterium]
MRWVWVILFSLLSVMGYGQQILRIFDKTTEIPLSEVDLKDADDNSLGISDKNGYVSVFEGIREIYIDHPGYPPQYFSLPVLDNIIYLEQELVSLRRLEIMANDKNALNLVKKVIDNQSINSPKSLANYSIKSYTKFWADAEADSIAYISNPKTKSDSAQNRSKKLLQNSMLFLSERAISHYFDRKSGEKNIVEAAKVSGIRTPMYEFVAMQPISVEFNQKEFDFFFRKFPNPFSRQGMKSYNFIVTDTLERDNRKWIELNFNSKKEEKRVLRGTAWIDASSFALSRFYAENVTSSGSDTYIEVVYKPMHGVWVPDYQIFKLEGDNVNTAYYRDSIGADGVKTQIKVNKKTRSRTIVNTSFSDFQTPVNIDPKILKGLDTEVPRKAFTDFENRIQEFRNEELQVRELTTYIKIDSIGEASKIDRYVKLFRVISQEGWLNLGHIDWDLKELYSGNAYEDFRFGVALRTSQQFHPRLSINSRLYYGTMDKKFKYGIGAEYLLNSTQMGKVFVDYSDDISPMGRFRNPIYTFGEAYTWLAEQASNPYFVDEQRITIGYEQDLLKKTTFRLSAYQTPQTPLFEYHFGQDEMGATYELTGLQLAFRYAPKEESVSSPLGKFRIKRDLPIYKLLIDQGLSGFGGNQEFTRLDFSANFSWSIFSEPTYLNLRAGKVFGEVPLWNYFDGGGKSRDKSGFWQRVRFGGTQIFETMIPGEFISDQYAFLSLKQKFWSIRASKDFRIPLTAVYKIGLGDFSHPELHSGLNFKTMNQPYQEAGIEIDNIFLRFFGIGIYYRMGAYQLEEFDRNIAVKVLFNFTNF